MRGLNPAPLHHQLGLVVLLDCGIFSRNIAYMQGLGLVADIVRVWGWAWVMLQRGLVAFWRQALPGMPAMLGPRSTKRCKYRQESLC